LRNVLLKTLLLLAAFNLIFVVTNPLPWLGGLSLYNAVLPGRQRFPFGEDPQLSYNLSIYSVEAMFAAHEVSVLKNTSDEYRVFLLGDSSTWGTLLRPHETLAGQLNGLKLTACDGREVRFYNLGYPTISLTKDLMILAEAVQYRPDLILWLTTLEAFPKERQLDSPLAANNRDRVLALVEDYDLDMPTNELMQPDAWDLSIVGQRRALADLARLQAYGILWAATGIDQVYPDQYPPAERDLKADQGFHDRLPADVGLKDLSWDVLEAGLTLAGKEQVVIINEPILISAGQNSDIRYNFFYPRWAYDKYRDELGARAESQGWKWIDAWDWNPQSEFTNSAIHRSVRGESILAERIRAALIDKNSCLR